MSVTVNRPVEVALSIETRDGAVKVVVDHDGEEYASVFAPTLAVALQMVVPYIASVARPDPFASMIAQCRELKVQTEP